MNKYTLLVLSALVILSCKSKPSKLVNTHQDTSLTKNEIKISDTINPKGVSKVKDGLPAIEGLYKATPNDPNSEACDITVEIKRGARGFVYSFKLSDTTYTGKITLSKDENEKSTFVNFEGIKWAEYEGDISNEDDNDDNRPSLELPVGVGGHLSGNEIMIQNYGNAMNSYLVFSECDDKYIRLVKQ